MKNLVAELVQTLPLAVASGALRDEIDTILKTVGLFDHFRAIVAAEDVNQGKPEPEIYLKALAGLNAGGGNRKPTATADRMVIEDSNEGIRRARSAGMKYLAATNSHPAELLSEAIAIFKSLEGVKLNFPQNMCP